MKLVSLVLYLTTSLVSSFSIKNRQWGLKYSVDSSSRRLLSRNNDEELSFNPLGLSFEEGVTNDYVPSSRNILLGISSFMTASAFNNEAYAEIVNFDPDKFRPICPASDVFYGILKDSTGILVGEENFEKYSPIIAEGLLRIRLELCVVESYFNEAVGPFIAKNGLNWVLPIHETIDTFIAGIIFATATAFISVGSTKIVTVVFTYTDFLIGAPIRAFGGFAFDRARGKPITVDIGIGPWKTRLLGPKKDSLKEEDTKFDITKIFDGASPLQVPLILLTGSLKSVGEALKILRQIIEAIDLFVGRYLVIIATGYVGIKFLHFKVFPDFPESIPDNIPEITIPFQIF